MRPKQRRGLRLPQVLAQAQMQGVPRVLPLARHPVRRKLGLLQPPLQAGQPGPRR